MKKRNKSNLFNSHRSPTIGHRALLAEFLLPEYRGRTSSGTELYGSPLFFYRFDWNSIISSASTPLKGVFDPTDFPRILKIPAELDSAIEYDWIYVRSTISQESKPVKREP